MATYSRKILKNGTVRYSIQLCIKNALTGKNEYPNKTWSNPDRLTGVRAEKAAIAFGEAWEKEYRSGKPKESQSTASFAEVADKYLEINKSRWAKATYFRNVEIFKGNKGLNNYFGSKVYSKITPIEIQEYIAMLNNYEFQTESARIKESGKLKLEQAIKNHSKSLTKTCEKGFISRPILYSARIGEAVSWDTAKIICLKFGLSVNEIFDKQITTKKYAKESILKYTRALCTIFNWGIRMRYIETNFASGTYTRNVIKGEKREKKKLLTDDEMKRLFEVLETMPIRYALPLWLLSKLGITTAEYAGLNWAAIDWDKRLISIEQDRVYIPKLGVVEGATKNEYRNRTLPLDDKLMDKLKEAKAEYDFYRIGDPNFDNCGAIFYYWKQYGKQDGSPANPTYINNLLKKVLLDAMLPTITAHKLRNGVITKLMRNNVSLDVIAPIMGHKDGAMAISVYTEYCKDMATFQDALAKAF